MRMKNVCHPIWPADEINRIYAKHLPKINLEAKLGDKVDELTSKLSVDHWPRKLALYDFHTWIQDHSLQSPDRLALLGDAPEAEFLSPKNRLEHLFVPLLEQNDLHDMGAMKKLRDFRPSMILLGDVFQSLHDPQLAMSNIFDALEDGGYVFLCAPLTGVSDQMPFHFYHSTWMGLAVLLESSGFETVEIRQWGNLHYELLVLQSTFGDWGSSEGAFESGFLDYFPKVCSVSWSVRP